MNPNMLRSILCTPTAAVEAGFLVSVTELLELFSARDPRDSGTFTTYPNPDRNLIHGLPNKDECWGKYWFLFKINASSVNGMADMVHNSWAIAPGKC